ncbi:hypothetical protein H6F86_20495 [Phormidium sp. FACHB-592]|uniref:Transcriptional regulator n=1 Tax=Stenomitos frigidus AS-A4 TaxID=2933935 RepID=A0ABV0KEV5_9CYAN|nr:hypothetical protein [Phormidium sp. FACHB-592]MBD2076212.1 hypothetical protein [Phormidium sp. FACHB-592]
MKSLESPTQQELRRRFVGNFKNAVERSAYSDTQLTDMMGLHRTAIYEIVNSGRKVDPAELSGWCRVLCVSFQDLVG